MDSNRNFNNFLWYLQLLTFTFLIFSLTNPTNSSANPFVETARQGSLKEVEQNFDSPEKLNVTDKDGVTPLIAASESNHLKVVKYLVNKGAKINARHDRGGSALHHAAGFNSLEIVQFLLNSGANLKSRNNRGVTPLMVAAQFNNVEVIKYLLDVGAKINTEDYAGLTPLMFAVTSNNNPKKIKFLLSQGAKVNRSDSAGNSPLWLATRTNRSPEIVKILLDSGAKPNIQGISGLTPIMASVQQNGPYERKTLRLLKKGGGSVNKKDNYGQTALMISAGVNNHPAVKELLQLGAIPNITDEKNRTALIHAAKNNDKPLKIIKLLLNNGAKIKTVDSSGKTALDYVKGRKLQDINEMKELLKTK